MFEKTLQDLVKGIRAHKRDPSAFISQSIAEIKLELRSVDPFIKAQAVRKLTYLQMIGYDMSWAAFSVIEVMTSARFGHKRVGYLAANQTFTEETDVILLTTNHLKKEFNSGNQYDIGLAINCLANIATPDLSRDLLGDVSALLTHQRSYVRKKALLVMYKLFINYPQGLRLCFDRIRDRLDDTDSGVVSCAVNIICELADKNPRNYLALAPRFFRLLTTSSNNWMLIKVVKLLGSLVPEEPRLARKLLEPLATIIQNTAAKSLLYECIHTVTLALPFTKKEDGSESRAVPVVVKLCADNLRNFIQDPDQNLKYLGLVGYVNLMQSHPRAVAESRELVLACLTDDDVTIRTRALELLTGMVTKRTLEELVVQLLKHVVAAEGAYREDLIAKIVLMCSRDKYAFLVDFQWYTGALVELARMDHGCRSAATGALLASQLIDVALRVESVRAFAVEAMAGLLLESMGGSSVNLNSNLTEVLLAAAWIVGEYGAHVGKIRGVRGGSGVDSGWARLIGALLREECLEALPVHVVSIFVHNAFKVLIRACQPVRQGGADDGDLAAVIAVMDTRLGPFEQSAHMEIQERACLVRALLVGYGIFKNPAEAGESYPDVPTVTKPVPPPPMMDLLGLGTGTNGMEAVAPVLTNGAEPADASAVSAARSAAAELAALTAEVMKPVNPRAQSKVPPPDDVDLDTPLNPSVWLDFVEGQPDPNIVQPDLSRLSFTQVVIPTFETETGYDSYLDAPSSSDYEAGRRTGQPTHFRDGSPGSPAVRRVGGGQDPFYLGARGPQPGSVNPAEVDVSRIPIARLTAKDLEQDEDYAGVASRRRKDKKRRKEHKKKKEYSVETEEAMPVGVASSDDDAGVVTNAGTRPRSAAGRPTRPRGGGKDEASGLSAVDITTPLREDEKIPEQRHRQVQEQQQQLRQQQRQSTKPQPHAAAAAEPAAAAMPQGTAEREHKKPKTSKKGKSRHGNRHHDAAGGTAALLDLMDFGSEVAADSAPTAARQQEDMMAFSHMLATAAPTLGAMYSGGEAGPSMERSTAVDDHGKEKRSSKKSKKKHHHTSKAASADKQPPPPPAAGASGDYLLL